MQCLNFVVVVACILFVLGQISIILSWLPSLWPSIHYVNMLLALLT